MGSTVHEVDCLEGQVEVDDKDVILNPTIENVRAIVEKFSYKHFTWDNDESDWPPLMVDVQTANVLCTIYDAFDSDKSRDKFGSWIRGNRALFIKAVDFCWAHIK